jgi:hypothetical protein
MKLLAGVVGCGLLFQTGPAGTPRTGPDAVRESAMRESAIIIDRIDHIVLTVVDVEVTCEFYARLLGMKVVAFGDGRTALAFGRQKINLHRAGHEIDPKATHPTPGSADI